MREHKAGWDRKIFSGAAKIILLTLLFTLVFAGTLSGAFAVENLADNGANIDANIADASFGSNSGNGTVTTGVDTGSSIGKYIAWKSINDARWLGETYEKFCVFTTSGDLATFLKAGVIKINVGFTVTNGNDDYNLSATLRENNSGGTVLGSIGPFKHKDGVANKTYTFSASNTTATTFYIAISWGGSSTDHSQVDNIYIEFVSKSYTVTINQNSGVDGATSQTVAGGTKPANISPLSTRTGYDLKGYYTSSSSGTQLVNSSGVWQASKSGYTDSSARWIRNGNITIYAQWTAHTGKITYNANGGSGSATQNFNYSNGTIDLNGGSGFIRSGYTLVGWAKSATAAERDYELGKNVSVTSGDFNLASKSTNEFTLYAVWKQSDFGVLTSGTSGLWGSATNPFVISTPQHLVNLSNIVNGTVMPFDSVTGKSFMDNVTTKATEITFADCYFVVTADLDMSTTEWQSKFAPIGKSDSNYFRGVFYGGTGVYSAGSTQRTITLNINLTANYSGLFGYVYKNQASTSPRIEKITVNGTIKGASYVGAIAGHAQDTAIVNCINNATVTGTGDAVGGIAGFCFGGTPQWCVNNGAVTGVNYVGGIAGQSRWGGISNSTNNANVTGSGSYVGGISGSAETSFSITNCKNTSSTVSGKNAVGGIVGYAKIAEYTIVISACENSAQVSASEKLNLTFDGSSKAGAFIGGIVGYAEGANISHCNNSGTVTTKTSWTSSDFAGGIVGVSNGIVQYCYNSGTVWASSNVGGIVGYAYGSANVSYCYFDAELKALWTNTNAVAGFIYGGKNGATASNNIALLNAKTVAVSNVTYNKTLDGFYTISRAAGDLLQPTVVPVVGTTDTAWGNILTQNIDGVKIVYTIGVNKYFNTNYKLSSDNLISGYSNADNTAPTNLFAMTVGGYYGAILASDNAVQGLANRTVTVGIADFTKKLTLTDGTTTFDPLSSAQADYSGKVWQVSHSLNGDIYSFVAHYSGTKNDNAQSQITAATKDVGNYYAWAETAIDGKVVGVTTNQSYQIQAKSLTLNPENITDSYTYNAAHQGLKTLTADVVQQEDITKILALTATNCTVNPTVTNNIFTISGAINAGNYSVSVALTGSDESRNYTIQTDPPVYEWTIEKFSITWSANKNGNNGDTFTNGSEFEYNGSVQGLTSVVINKTPDNIGNILEYSSNGEFETDPYKSGSSYIMAAKNAGNYEFTLSLKDNETAKNYEIKVDDTTNAEEITFSWTISPKEISVADFYYSGTVANNDKAANGYPLNRSESDHNAKPALVYQDGNYVFADFKVWDSLQTLTLQAYGEKSVGAAFYAVYNGANIDDISQMSLPTDPANQNPTRISLKFVSLDVNFKFADSEDTVYYTLMMSDFGVLNGKTRDNSWGSEENPYVISDDAHLLRLSHIVNGGTQWDSISLGFADDSSYADCYFVATANLNAKTSMGFVPIGGHETDGSVSYDGNNISNVFAGTFGGATLNVDGSDVERDGGNSILYNNKIIITANIDLLSVLSSYAGVFGYTDGARIASIVVDSRSGVIQALEYVGGAVGYANGGTVENVSVWTSNDSQNGIKGASYIGGLVGYANGATILQLVSDDSGNTVAYTDFFTGRVYSGTAYVGGIVGYWVVTDRNQVNNGYDLAYGASNVEIAGTKFVGGIAGYFDASGCANGLSITATLKSNPTVSGSSFVGGLYGVFIGSGYKKTSAVYDANKDSIINLDSAKVAVSVKLTGAGNAVGGVFGYVGGVGLIFTSIGSQITSTTTPVNINGNTPNFLGVISGIIGENATIENPGDPTDGNYYDVYISADLSGGDFVGSIAGYVSSNAGVYYGSTGTLFGNRIILVSNGTTSGKNYVGGIFGAIGKITGYTVSEDNADANALLNSALNTAGSTSVLTFGPRVNDWNDSTQPWGRVANLQSVTGSGNYVGGIVGGVFSNARLVFENPVYDSALSNSDAPYSNTNATFRHTPIFNGNAGESSETSQITISGVNYVGGIAGYLGDGAHSLKYVVNRAKVGNAAGTSKYVGGIAGQMNGGVIANSMSVIPSGTDAYNATADIYKGSQYVGGIVGNLTDGRVENCISTGMKFTGYADTKSQVGGVAGEVGQNATVKSSWTVYIATNPTYATVPTSGHGKFVIIDDKIDYVPTYTEIAKTIGLYSYDLPNSGLNASDMNCETKTGYLSIGATVPINSNTNFNNQQLAFYDGTGADVATDNVFDAFENLSNIIRLRFDVSGDEEQNSFSICLTEIKFVDISPYSGSDAAGKKANAEKGYRAPSNGTRYGAEVTEATYNGTGNNISALEANAMFTPSTGATAVKIGEYSNTFSTGSSATPFIIATQKDWDDFAYSIYSGTRNYKGLSVKLVTDGIVIKSATSHNGNSFSSNGNYNFAGLLSIGGNSTLTAAEQNKVFQGTFDGGGHTITVNFSSTSYARASVFPNAMNATFKNLTIAGTINAATSYKVAAYDIAGFVAKPFGALTFENCTNAANVSGLRNVGGLVGYSTGYTMNFIACVNTGNITSFEGSYTLGGRDKTTYSYDDGWSNTGYTYGTGGIIGTFTGSLTIESCRNSGTVTGGHNVGGIIGLSNGGTLTINNCANTGSVTANSGYNAANISARGDSFDVTDEGGNDGDSSRGVRENIFGYAGGIVGKTGQTAILNMYASYNAGNIMTLANIAGGLVGAVGTMYQPKGEKNAVKTGGKSTIAYCYNVGTVTTGGTHPKHVAWWSGGRENYGGTIAGGIAGLVGNILITQSYNAGDIYSYGVIAYGGSWQNRQGGIVGQSQPVSDGTVTFTYLYNVGSICLRSYNCWVVGGFSVAKNVRYGASISGYCDTEDASKRISSSNIYSIANSVSIKIAEDYTGSEWNTEKRGDWIYDGGVMNIGGAIEGLVVVGNTYDTFEQLTALMNNVGTIKPRASSFNLTQSTASLTSSISPSNIPSGWIYVYGCLPQLAVFALDTQNGLSMRSVGYGKDQYGDYVKGTAGSEEYPFIIKDGIDLLGLSALTNLGYNFSGKYIEFANADNNLDGMQSKTINMPTSTSTSTNLSSANAYKSYNGSAYQTGKSYHLFSMGALCNTAYNSDGSKKAVSAEYTVWVNNNYRYTGSSTALSTSSGTTLGLVNFYPIGIKSTSNIFAGNVSGEQLGGTNTHVQNLKISMTSSTSLSGSGQVYAGLFGRTQNSTISNITVSGEISAYANGTNRIAAGGIVGFAGGSTVIDHCQSGYSLSYTLTVNATRIGNATSYAGGIAGIVSNELGAKTPIYPGSSITQDSYTSKAGSHTVIRNCTSLYAYVYASTEFIGGIAGYASATKTGTTTGMSGSYVDITDCTVNRTVLNDIDKTNASSDIRHIGGIVGTSDKYIALTISGCSVGTTGNASYPVSIKGSYALGGIMGSVSGSTRIENCSVGRYTTITRSNDGYNAAYTTAIGGLVGYSEDSSEKLLTFGGNITFAGSIVINKTVVVKNIGGVIGYMGSGSRFQSGSNVSVTGSITMSGTQARSDIGGVAGLTNDVSFSGTFSVSPTMSGFADDAENVGGFIGENIGKCAILSDNTVITIGGTIGGKTNVGGFIGKNAADASLIVAPDSYDGISYISSDDTLTINIGATISAVGDNVGGLVGLNAEGNGEVSLTKGVVDIKASASVKSTGGNNVGGIIGNNSKALNTGGSVSSVALQITNNGIVSGVNNVGGIIGLFSQGVISGEFTNLGSVSGASYVGGSIGYMDASATIDARASRTLFVNGDKSAATTSDDALVAADYATTSANSGSVSATGDIAGGSIGGMHGTIIGSEQSTAVFENYGDVSANNYIGGSIGMLTGSVAHAVFVNDASMNLTGSAKYTVGGSIGYVGNPNADEAAVSITNTHFEFNGAIDITAGETDTGNENGIGGAIGVIKQSDEWENNTFYVSGSINAPNLNNVGGVVGLILEDNIEIRNMLAYYTSVIGNENVGGIVGATHGANTVIDNSFNVEGTVEGTTAGGIIGLAQADTDAGTSYWVKSVMNSELEKADINSLRSSLGKLGNITLDGVAMSASTSSPISYFNEKFVANDTNSATQTENVDQGDGTTVERTTTTDTMNVTILRGDTQYAITLTRKTVKYENITTTYSYEYGGASTELTEIYVDENNVESGNDKWSAILTGIGAVYKESNGFYVYDKTDGSTYTTGEKNTGWYFVYADTSVDKTLGEINTLHGGTEHSVNNTVNLAFWKRIAHAYKADEIEDDPTGSLITADGTVDQGTVYANATKGKSGYYLYIAASNKNVLPKMSEKDDGSFFISVLANADDVSLCAQNIAIYYKTLEIDANVIYNGYDRYTPVKNTELVYGAQTEGYYYVDSMPATKPHDAATYSDEVVVYFKSEGNAMVVGGIDSVEWKIKAKEVEVINSTLNGIYGNTNNVTTITAKGIAATDGVGFILSVSIDNQKWYIKTGTSETDFYVSKDGTTWEAGQDYQIMSGVKFVSANVSIDTTRYSNNDKKFSYNDYANGAYWNKLDLKIEFNRVKSYTLDFGYDKAVTGDENYTIKSKVNRVNVNPQKLTITIDAKNTGCAYDGKSHGTAWTIAGWVNNENIATLFDGKTYQDLFNVKAVQIKNNVATEFTDASLIWQANTNLVTISGLIDVASYALQFDGNVANGKLMFGNYYFEVNDNIKTALDTNKRSSLYTIGTVEIVITNWSDSPSAHEYDQKAGSIIVEMQVKDGNGNIQPIANYIDIINSYYSVSMTPAPAQSFSVKVKDTTTASATFTTGTNAGRYTATLSLNSSVSASDRANCKPEETNLSGSHTITKRTVTLDFVMSGSSPYTYDTKHHGLNSVTIGNVLTGDSVKVTIDITNSVRTDSKTSYSSGTSLGITTSDADTYTANVKAISNSNYQLPQGTNVVWIIKPKALNMSVSGNSQSATYDGTEKHPNVSLTDGANSYQNTYYSDDVSFNYKVDGASAVLINAGTYALTCDTSDFAVFRNGNTIGDNGIDLINNYDLSGGAQSLTYTINKAVLQLGWTNDTLTYDRTAQGQVLASASSGSTAFTVSGGNIVNAFEGDVISFTLTGKSTNAGSYTMHATSPTLSNANRADSTIDNYSIAGADWQYTIGQAVVSISGITGISTVKVYDATTDVAGTPSIVWSGAVKPNGSEYTVIAVYNDKNVALADKIVYTVSNLNANFTCADTSGETAASITPCPLNVLLDKLRNSKATKSFDGTVYYGGEKGFVNGDSSSQIYRSGEGFRVTGFPSAETAGVVCIIAKYAEENADRTAFDAYVNNVVYSGGEYKVDASAGYFKKLVFTMGGDGAGNYTFSVKNGTTELATSSNGVATVFDQNDSANVGAGKNTSNIFIEITVRSIRASYENTAQSYANADNTYNTDWQDVKASTSADGISISVKNGWRYENGVDGTPKKYDKYTVIRGRVGSGILSASIAANANGLHVNYSLSNQPILTIGYFIDSTDFEIGSMASLMIATYYQHVYANKDNPDFNTEIIGLSEWKLIVSEADYAVSGSFENHKPSDAGECTSWDEYFAMLEGKGIYVFLNTSEGANSGWGYYTASEENGTPKSYSSFKQVANVSGVLTDADISILDSFFTVYKYNADGTVSSTPKEWGFGGEYITNFIKVGAGSAVTAIGSMFSDEFGTGCVYDGNGYTINYVNIVSYDSTANVGMFANVTSGGVVKNVHLRNASIVVNGGGNVGGIIGLSSMSATLENCSFHGSITANGNGTTLNVGGVIGSGNTPIDGVIVMGNIDVTNSASSNVGGVTGRAYNAVYENIVSMIEIYANGNVGAIVGNPDSSIGTNDVYYMTNSSWTKDLVAASGKFGEGKTYAELFTGSNSGYANHNYFASDARTGAGVYDMLDNFVKLDVDVSTSPRESMRLRDMIDVYLLMYSLEEGSATILSTDNVGYYTISAASWLVGNKHGTNTGDDAIVIANQQGVALLRELRFASFKLTADVEMYSTHAHSVFDGVFYGNVVANGYVISLQGTATKMFEKDVNGAIPIKTV